MVSNLKQYPSGFLGSSLVEQSSRDPDRHANKVINQILNRVDVKDEGSQQTYSTEVENIWLELLSNSQKFKNFDFNERIITCAIKIFGTEYFSEWVATQVKNPNFSKMHQKFIDDTILYVYYNKRREYTINNWLGLLDDTNKNNVVDKYSDIQKNFFSSQNPFKEEGVLNTSLTIENLVTLWVNQENGIEDLATSLYVLFGDR